MDEHPLFRMWKDQLDADVERENARATRRAEREAERAGWYAAWQGYKARASVAVIQSPLPRWWNVPGWVLWLLRLHAAGRPN